MIPLKDLETGQGTERKIVHYLILSGWDAEIKNSDHKQDIVATYMERVRKIEVKNEDNYYSSGNICIETHQGNPKRDSGIKTSESDIYIHSLCDIVVMYNTKNMVKWLGDNKDSISICYYEQFPGANYFNGGYVLPIDLFLPYLWFDQRNITAVGDSDLLWYYGFYQPPNQL